MCGDCTPTIHATALRKGLQLSNDGLQSRLLPKAATSIWLAAANGDAARLQHLLAARNVQPDLLNTYGISPLHKACFDNHAHIIQLLLQHGANPDAGHEECGATALLRATSWKALECMQVLLQNGANVHAQDMSFQDRRTPLHKACAVGYAQGVQLLLEWGSQTSVRDAKGKTPLEVAIVQGHISCVQLLWESNQVATVDDRISDSVLVQLAVDSGQVQLLQHFMQQEKKIASAQQLEQCIAASGELTPIIKQQ